MQYLADEFEQNTSYVAYGKHGEGAMVDDGRQELVVHLLPKSLFCHLSRAKNSG